LRPPCWKPVLK